MTLKVLKELPEGFLSAKASELHALLGGPTLIHLEANQVDERPAVFISILLHGNEHSGLTAIQNILKSKINRSLILFVGNTLAAEQNLRHLADQSDFNRVWTEGSCELARTATKVLQYVSDKPLLCSIDIHNNTGTNPFYSCVNVIHPEFLALADIFADSIVYFTEPHEVQSMAFSKICPSITIEAGQSGDVEGIQILEAKLKEVFELEFLPTQIDQKSLDIYHTVGRMKFDLTTSLDFEFDKNSPNHFSFQKEIDLLNFTEVPAGAVLAYVNNPEHFSIESSDGTNFFKNIFKFEDNKLIVKKSFIPAMITKNITIIKDDCFGYVMERY